MLSNLSPIAFTNLDDVADESSIEIPPGKQCLTVSLLLTQTRSRLIVLFDLATPGTAALLGMQEAM